MTGSNGQCALQWAKAQQQLSIINAQDEKKFNNRNPKNYQYQKCKERVRNILQS